MTTRGKLVFTILFLALVGFGVFKWWDKLNPAKTGPAAQTNEPAKSGQNTTGTAPGDGTASAGLSQYLAPLQTDVSRLDPPGAYHSKDGIVDIELSVYPGYAGIIAANGGLDPNENSVFAKKYGFKVRIKLSEEESWSALNSGKMAASATTADVLAVYGRQFAVSVPVQIGYSRGADGIVVNNSIHRVNDLKGKILTSSQFTESDFFIRYLAQEAGLPVKALATPDTVPDEESVNLLYAQDAFTAADAFLAAPDKIAGCVTWEPKTTETVEQAKGKAQILTTNRNLLIVADVLVVNKGWEAAEPDKVKGLVAGILEGNQMVRNDPEPYLDVIAKAFDKPKGAPEDRWDKAKARRELQKIHFANGPENLAFFSGAIDAAGSFSGIYQSAIYSYGSDFIKNPVDSDRFADTQYLKALDGAGAFAGQTIKIQPIKSSAGRVETDPLLSKDVRFFFDPNEATLSARDEDANNKNFAAIKQMLQVSPGSKILLRGHVDPSKVSEFRKQGEAFLRARALDAVELSKRRANEVRRVLIEREKIAPERLETQGRGWDEPATKDPNKMDQNRRVEAQWFTLE